MLALPRMRIAIVYDCLYPNTVGGAERWLRVLAAALAESHDVTYVTRRQWARGDEPSIPGVRVLAVSPGTPLYTQAGRRRLTTPILFGIGVFRHFLRHRHDYDIVHCVSYPFLSLIALRAALVGRRETRVFCEWIECLTPAYWHSYGGLIGGSAGRLVQAACLRLSPAAFVFSDLVEARLRRAAFGGDLHRLTGLWAGIERNGGGRSPQDGDPVVLFFGRHLPDKRVTMLPDALLAVRRSNPNVRAVIVGDGPERPRLLARIAELGLEDAVEAPGFVPREELDALLCRAACVVSPSVRDGHGMVAVEAAAAGLPVVVCDHPDNAATEHVQEGVNGAVAPSPAPDDIAAAILRVIRGGQELRESTSAWFAAERERLSMSASIATIRKLYEGYRHRPGEQDGRLRRRWQAAAERPSASGGARNPDGADPRRKGPGPAGSRHVDPGEAAARPPAGRAQ
jgi:glycosyltransferase involved in cell wall biosynthesis